MAGHSRKLCLEAEHLGVDPARDSLPHHAALQRLAENAVGGLVMSLQSEWEKQAWACRVGGQVDGSQAGVGHIVREPRPGTCLKPQNHQVSPGLWMALLFHCEMVLNHQMPVP